MHMVGEIQVHSRQLDQGLIFINVGIADLVLWDIHVIRGS